MKKGTNWKNKLPIVLAVLIVLLGLAAPRAMLWAKKSHIMGTSGGSGSRELAVYQNGAGQDLLAQRIGTLSQQLILNVNGITGVEWETPREPLDTELTKADSIRQTENLYRCLYDKTRNVMNLPTPTEGEKTAAYFFTLGPDPSLSFYAVKNRCVEGYLDALSGLPMLVACNVPALPEERAVLEEIYGAVAGTYNALYGTSLCGGFSEEPSLILDGQDAILCCGSAGPYCLAVSLSVFEGELRIELTAEGNYNLDTTP